MPEQTKTVEFSPDSAVSANTQIDIGKKNLPDKMDTRGGRDPIVSVTIEQGASDTSTSGTTVFNSTSLTSQGKVGSSPSLSAGQVGYVDGGTIVLGNALNAYDMLQITFQARGGTNTLH